MGDVFSGLHSPIAACLIRSQEIKLAFETGTHFGFGALQLAAMVDEVWTVDFDPGLFEFCTDTYGAIPNIKFLQGESGHILRESAKAFTEPTLFVLDAHWFPMSPRAEHRPSNLCPVLDELQVIAEYYTDILGGSAVIVDDAQMFLGAVKAPLVRNAIPSITEVIDKLNASFDRVIVTDDVIVGCSELGAAAIGDYLKWRDRLKIP